MEYITYCTAAVFIVLVTGAVSRRQIILNRRELKTEYTISPVYICFLFVAILTFVATCKYGFIDSNSYKLMYTKSKDASYILHNDYNLEAGWIFLLHIMNYITQNPKLMFFTGGLIIYYANTKMVYKYSGDIYFSMYLIFILIFIDTNNGLRQFVAASITILAFDQMAKGEYKKYMPVILLASAIHRSALVCILFYIIVNSKNIRFWMTASFCATFFILFVPGSSMTFLTYFLKEDGYIGYILRGTSSNFIRVIVQSVPFVLALLFIRKNRRHKVEITKYDEALLRLIILNECLAAMAFKLKAFARIELFTEFAVIIMLPRLINTVFNKKDARRVKVIAVILYFIYFMYGIYVNYIYGNMTDFYFTWN